MPSRHMPLLVYLWTVAAVFVYQGLGPGGLGSRPNRHLLRKGESVEQEHPTDSLPPRILVYEQYQCEHSLRSRALVLAGCIGSLSGKWLVVAQPGQKSSDRKTLARVSVNQLIT